MTNCFRILSLLLLLCTSCSSGNKLHVVLNDGFGVDEGDEVELNNVKIGTIDAIHFTKDYKICLTLTIDESVKIPADSKCFFLINVLEIEPGKSQRFLTEKDTLFAVQENNYPVNELIDKVSDFIDSSRPVRNQDTIIEQLNELNTEVHKLNEKIRPKGK
ncbi:MlaD family protein [Fluviicola sp.]|uniref:MlaD family protein n=1 Tax=Fluviicola sp. TaxID=1917219 RepID=UPI0031CE9A7D